MRLCQFGRRHALRAGGIQKRHERGREFALVGRRPALRDAPAHALVEQLAGIAETLDRLPPAAILVAAVQVQRDHGDEEGQRFLDRDVAYVSNDDHAAHPDF